MEQQVLFFDDMLELDYDGVRRKVRVYYVMDYSKEKGDDRRCVQSWWHIIFPTDP